LPTAALAPEPLHPALATMARETRVRRGAVARELDGETVAEGCWRLAGDAFLLCVEGGIRIHYRRGEGVTIDSPAGVDERDLDLWLNGSVHAAVAALNGLLPLHASAVEHRGRIYAFAGPPGAGKSTLAAALGHDGVALWADDTLVLDLAGEGTVVCLPGHKRLKLWPDGVRLAGARAGEQVASDYPKYFAEPARTAATATPLPLAAIYFLEEGPAIAVRPLRPAERIARLDDDHYTARMVAAALDRSGPHRFAQLAALAARVPMARFVRPLDPARFAETRAVIADHIRGASAA
jgi:hypothetical protein